VTEFLSEWMRGLILVIFLAVFLEMILPHNKFQRYARMVMGLTIILMMMGPVLKLYGASIYEMDFSVETMFGTRENRTDMPTLDQITAMGQKLEESQTGMTSDQLRAALAEQVKHTVEQVREDVSVASVKVELELDAAKWPKRLSAISLDLTERQAEGAIKPIKPVEPVVIGKQPESDIAKERSASQAHKEAREAIREKIATEFGLPVSRVQVNWRES
jgi:stage III sporulation protein AF